MMDDKELSTLIQGHATRHKASEPLRASVRTQVALEMAKRADKKMPAPRRWLNFDWRWMWGSGGAGFASGVALTLAITWMLPLLMLHSSLPDELVADHVRALRGNAMVQVASSDQHTVKPWFQGKLDYAPPVVDLASEGFPLLGGRIEHRAGAPIAALTYTSRSHIVNVFVWPVKGQRAPQRMQRSGFNLLHWDDGAMQVWAVSDLDAAELERFGQAWRARMPER
jgi:anti-sigma factor RsiW